MKGVRLTYEQIVSIYLAPGRQQVIAQDYGISQGHVCKIKSGNLHAGTTAPFRANAVLNATLVTLAFTSPPPIGI